MIQRKSSWLALVCWLNIYDIWNICLRKGIYSLGWEMVFWISFGQSQSENGGNSLAARYTSESEGNEQQILENLSLTCHYA